MQCPACKNDMQKVTAGEITIDVCSNGCGGIWFDAGELDHFDDGKEFDPQTLVQFKISKEGLDQNAIRECPRCPHQILVRQFYDVQEKVQMNQCWNCGGIFLDRGELSILKSEYANDEEHRAAIEDYAKQCIDQHTSQMNAETKAWKEKYEATHASRYKASVSMFKEMLGIDED